MIQIFSRFFDLDDLDPKSVHQALISGSQGIHRHPKHEGGTSQSKIRGGGQNDFYNIDTGSKLAYQITLKTEVLKSQNP